MRNALRVPRSMQLRSWGGMSQVAMTSNNQLGKKRSGVRELGHANWSKLENRFPGDGEGHGQTSCLPCAADAHNSGFGGRNVSARTGRGAARRRGWPLRGRTCWRRTLFRQPYGWGQNGWFAFRLDAPWFWKSSCAAGGAWNGGHPRYLAPFAARPREGSNAGPCSVFGIHSAGAAAVSSVSGFLPTPFRWEQLFLFFSVSPSSQFFLSVFSGIGLLLQRFDSGLFL